MNSFDEALKKKSALRSATGNPLGPQQPAARLPQYTTPAVLDAQRRADAAARTAAASRPAPTPLRAGIPGPNTMIADSAGNIARTPGDMAGFQANSQPRVDSVAANRAEIDRIKAENAARGQGPLRAGAGAPPPPVQPPPAAAASAPPPDPVKPVRGVAGEAPAKPGLGDKIRSKLRMAPKAAPGAVKPALSTRIAGSVGNMAGRATRFVGGKALAVAPLTGFGDYQSPETASGIDTSAAATMGYLFRGEGDKLMQNLAGGLKEAGADSVRGLGKTVDGLGSIFGIKPTLTPAIDSQLQAGGMQLRNPPAAAPAAAAALPGATAEAPRPAYVSPYANGVPDPGDPAQRAALEVLAQQAPGVGSVNFNAVDLGPEVIDGRIVESSRGQLAGGGVKRNSVASSLDANGNPVYDNASIARMQARSALSGTGGGGVASQSFGGPTTVAESPLRRPDLNRMGSGFAQTPSRASAINAQFDAVAKQIQDLHGSSKFGAKGSLATKLLRLEEARAQALGVDQNALVDSQGNQVADLSNKRTTATGLYDTELDERSALRRENGESARARVVAATEALKSRQQMSEQQLGLAKERAKAMATDKDGKVDQQAYLANLDAITVNFGGALDGSAETIGEAAGDMGDVGLLQSAINAKNKGSSNPDSSLGQFGALREPEIADVFDKNTNIGLRDYGRALLDDIPGTGLLGVDDAEFYEAADGNNLRRKDLTVDQIRALKRRGILRGEE